MSNEDYFDEFLSSGTVKSYLKYKEYSRAKAEKTGDTLNAVNYRRSGNSTKKSKGK